MSAQPQERAIDPVQLEREITERVEQAVSEAVNAGSEQAVTRGSGQSPIIISENNGESVTIDFKDGNLIISQDGNTRQIPWRDAVPQGAVDIAQSMAAIVFFLVVGWPIARAVARWIGRRGETRAADSALRQQFEARFENLERNLDTVAIEMEKLSEAQRFTTRLLAERGDRVTVPMHER